MANLLLSFLLELVLLWAVGFWGFETNQNRGFRWVLALGLPVLLAVFWGVFLSPRSDIHLSETLKSMLKILVFAAGVLALIVAGRPQLGYGFAALVVLNLLLAGVWKQ